jgi:hypothetical protein
MRSRFLLLRHRGLLGAMLEDLRGRRGGLESLEVRTPKLYKNRSGWGDMWRHTTRDGGRKTGSGEGGPLYLINSFTRSVI